MLDLPFRVSKLTIFIFGLVLTSKGCRLVTAEVDCLRPCRSTVSKFPTVYNHVADVASFTNQTYLSSFTQGQKFGGLAIGCDRLIGRHLIHRRRRIDCALYEHTPIDYHTTLLSTVVAEVQAHSGIKTDRHDARFFSRLWRHSLICR